VFSRPFRSTARSAVRLFVGGLAVIFRYPDPAGADPNVPVLWVEIVDDDDARGVTVAARGEIDIATVQLLDAGIQHGLRKKPDQLAVDLADVSFFGAAGLHALLAARRQAQVQAAQLVLSAPSGPVLTVLRLAKVEELFKIECQPPADGPGAAEAR
jgi:anti-sigma B factor antagonist